MQFGQRDRSRRAAVEDYDEPAEHTQSLTGNAVEIMSPSSSCYSDEAPTPVIGPGVGHSQLYETFSTSTESSCEACEEPLPIRAPEHYGDHMHAPLDEEAHREFANAPRAMPVEIVNSTSSSEARRRVTFVPFDDSSDMSDRQTNTSSSSSIPRSVRGILKVRVDAAPYTRVALTLATPRPFSHLVKHSLRDFMRSEFHKLFVLAATRTMEAQAVASL